ncbi:porin family protein [Vibrio rarus]|uniref:porin family protein n=1 Tax=Vibrio rarus TaxID=413403 RepID=UPI0021C44006|nr:porin family protein [Vibrio rarus]
MKLYTAMFLSGAFLVSGTAIANDSSGLYLGAGAGKTSFDDDGFASKYDDGFYKSDKPHYTGQNTAYILYAGYFFNRIIGLEASYADYGNVNFQADATTMKALSPTSFSFSANLGYTFDCGLRPFVKFGLADLDLKQSRDFTLLNKDSGAAIHYGLGLDYAPLNILPGLSFRVAYEGDSADIERSYVSSSNTTWNVSMLYGGISYKF